MTHSTTDPTRWERIASALECFNEDDNDDHLDSVDDGLNRFGETLALPFVREQPKVGHNDACPRGSGKKFKKCCGGSL